MLYAAFASGSSTLTDAPRAGPVLDRDAAVMLVDDLLHYREAQARAAGLGGHVGLEDARHQFLREAAAVVATPPGARVSPASSVRTSMDAGRAPSRTPILQRVLRVLHQVVDHLADLRAVGPDRRQRVVKPLVDRHAASSRTARARRRTRLFRSSRRGRRRRQARVIAEIVHHRLERRDLVDDGAGRAAQGLGVLARRRSPSFISSRSAESWIGVSGFLISCARRRATSAQAVARCAWMSWVMSSNTTT